MVLFAYRRGNDSVDESGLKVGNGSFECGQGSFAGLRCCVAGFGFEFFRHHVYDMACTFAELRGVGNMCHWYVGHVQQLAVLPG